MHNGFRWHTVPGLRLYAFAPSNSGKSCGTKFPACLACRRGGSFCSFESTGNVRYTTRWGCTFWSHFNFLPMFWRAPWMWKFLHFVSTESKFSSFWNLILDDKKPLFTTEKFLSQANDESGQIYCICFACFKFEDIKSWPFFHSVSSAPHTFDAVWKALLGPCSPLQQQQGQVRDI